MENKQETTKQELNKDQLQQELIKYGFDPDDLVLRSLGWMVDKYIQVKNNPKSRPRVEGLIAGLVVGTVVGIVVLS